MGLILRWISYLGLCLSTAFLGISFWYEAVLNTQLLPQVASNRLIQNQVFKTYLNDLEWLQSHPIFSRSQTSDKNFQEFLFQIQERHGENSITEHPALHPFFLDNNIKSQVLALGVDWIEKSYQLHKFEIDLSLFENILSYDYWDLSKPELNWGEKLEPFNLIVSTKIFVLKSIREHKSAEDILIKLRKLSVLLASCEDIHFKLSALSALKIEEDTYNFFNKRAPSDTLKNWKLISALELARIRRTLLATSGYLEPWTSPDILRQVFLDQESNVSFCPAYKLKKQKLEKLKPLFASHFPFEISFSESQKVLNLIAEKFKKECHDSKSQLTTRFEMQGERALDKLPYFRRMTGIKTAIRDLYAYQDYNL